MISMKSALMHAWLRITLMVNGDFRKWYMLQLKENQ